MNAEGESAPLLLTVAEKLQAADDIYVFELRHPSGQELPPFAPGAHITVTTPSGQKRRYSLCSDSTDRHRYVIAVKKETAGRGGSLSFTTGVEVGARVVVEPPGNDFPMSDREPKRYLFIAGGIGITPIRAMLKRLVREQRSNFQLYYLARTPASMAFREDFSAPEYAGKVVLHHDDGNPDNAYDLWPVLEEQQGAHLYCCGPRPLMDAVRDMTGHWSDGSVHFEDFVGATSVRPDDHAFTVITAKSGQRYEVPANASILDTLRQNGWQLASSCESGTCGTCRVRYLAGEPDHRDLVLSEREQRSEIMICVSRAQSAELTLDL
jgi:phthalate 4,5-dioxygenase reductase component